MGDVTLIEYYTPSGSEVEAAAERVRDRLPGIRDLARRVEKDHKHVLDSVAGDLKSSMADAPNQVTTRTNDVIQKSEFAAGCLELFAQAIDQHNLHKADRPRSVSRLNAEYNQGLDDKFGVKVQEPGPNATPDQVDKAWDAFWNDFNAERNALIHDLRKEAAELDTWLDGKADDVSKMLKRGPNQEDIRKLWKAGALSPYAPLVFPKAGLAGIRLPDAARKEFLEDLIAHPELLIAMPPALKAVVDNLPYWSRTQVYVEQRLAHLRKEGLLDGQNPDGYYRQWVRNTYLNGVPIPTVIGIARDHDIRPDDFDVLNGLKEIKDPDGKSYFLLPKDVSGDDAKKATLMTYILNAGTGYDASGDFDPAEEPYGSDQVQRIIDRQNAFANSRTYSNGLASFVDSGGRVVTTPNGILMGAGGGLNHDVTTQGGGTTWGDMFKVNEDYLDNPAGRLETIIRSGYAPDRTPEDGDNADSSLDLDHLLHHEEIHSRQWATHFGYAYRYGWEHLHDPEEENEYEKEAGLKDGGYPLPPGYQPPPHVPP